jgi:hypothetical protein
MKVYQTLNLKTPSSRLLLLLFSAFYLWNPLNAQATAPRVTPELFGEVKVADIVSYQVAPINAKTKAESDLAVELATAAFKAAGKSPVIDVLPSKQLATYALLKNDVIGLIANTRDLTTKQKSQYKVMSFLLVGNDSNDESIALILNTNSRGNELSQAFSEGLQTVIKNGQYLEILEKYRGNQKAPADYFTRLKKSPN